MFVVGSEFWIKMVPNKARQNGILIDLIDLKHYEG